MYQLILIIFLLFLFIVFYFNIYIYFFFKYNYNLEFIKFFNHHVHFSSIYINPILLYYYYCYGYY